MKKKLFFKLFIFAVIGAFVTVTSCKDYDDDISRLDTDLAAAKSSLTAAVAELNTLKAQIAAAATDSEVAAAVAAAKTEAINSAKAETTAQINALKGGYTGTLKELNDKIAANAGLITVLQGDVSSLKTKMTAAELQIAANRPFWINT
jgi:chromosome segregation ATPase